MSHTYCTSGRHAQGFRPRHHLGATDSSGEVTGTYCCKVCRVIIEARDLIELFVSSVGQFQATAEVNGCGGGDRTDPAIGTSFFWGGTAANSHKVKQSRYKP
jgi:hypothetical protein